MDLFRWRGVLEQLLAPSSWQLCAFLGALYTTTPSPNWGIAGPHSPCRSAAPPSYTAETTTFPTGESTPPSRARSKDPSWLEKNRPQGSTQTAACGPLDSATERAREAMGPMTVPSGRKGGRDTKWDLGVWSHHWRGHSQGRKEKKWDLRSRSGVSSRVEAGDRDGKALGQRKVVAA